MNLIMGMNALLLESPLNDKQRQHVEISYRNVRRLLRLINGILDLSKVEAGKLTLESIPFDLEDVLTECAATISSAIERKGLELEIQLHTDAWRFWQGDPERLQQVLLNLIGNSVKFTDRGKIELRVQPEPGPDAVVGLRFEVTDTGCGVPPEKADMIFEAFQQAEGSFTRPFEGTGLGLAIAKTIVELMAGRIWVERKTTPGAQFVFTAFFARSTEAAVCERATGSAQAKVARAVEPGTRLLLVEDNPENLILIQAFVENLKLSLDCASNGSEAVEKRQQGEYDLILMDIQMPVMDGYTATRKIRAWEKERGVARVPIVALSAHALSGAFANSIEAGCDSHVTKPVERNDLLDAIAKFAHQPPERPVVQPPEPPAEGAQAVGTRASATAGISANRWSDLEKMQTALAASDLNAIRIIGHNCKGTAAGYGFPEIGKVGVVIETAAKAGDTAKLAEAIRNFEACLRTAAAEN